MRLVSLLLLFLLACNPKEQEIIPPNVIIVFTDDQGYNDVGVFGSPDIETPHLDKMASEGLQLTSFYAAQAVCSASRAALLTGCYPNRIGIHQAFMPNSKIGINPDETTMAEMLKEAGYQTAIFGKWHLGDAPEFNPLNHGFDTWFGIPYSNDMWPLHPQQGSVFDFGPLPLMEDRRIIDTLEDQTMLTRQITERSLAFIEETEQPFFLYVAHPQPHVPLFVSDLFAGKSDRGLYGDVIMEIDWSVGQILETLTKKGIDDNTLVIFTSDNGPWLSYGEHSGSAYPLREGKGTTWEGGQRVPFLARWPGQIRPRISEEPLMTIDLMPTIAEITGAKLGPLPIDGKNAWDFIRGATYDSPQDTYYFYYRVNELHGIRYKDWKLHLPHTYRSLDGKPGGQGGQPTPYVQLSVDTLELYNLALAPEEQYQATDHSGTIVNQILEIAEKAREDLGDKLTGREGKGVRTAGRVSVSKE